MKCSLKRDESPAVRGCIAGLFYCMLLRGLFALGRCCDAWRFFGATEGGEGATARSSVGYDAIKPTGDGAQEVVVFLRGGPSDDGLNGHDECQEDGCKIFPVVPEPSEPLDYGTTLLWGGLDGDFASSGVLYQGGCRAAWFGLEIYRGGHDRCFLGLNVWGLWGYVVPATV